MEELAIAGTIGMLLPPVISFLKKQEWATQAKKRLSLFVCIVAAVASYFVQQGGWVGIEPFLRDLSVIYALAQTTYTGFWEDTALEVRLAQLRSAA